MASAGAGNWRITAVTWESFRKTTTMPSPSRLRRAKPSQDFTPVWAHSPRGKKLSFNAAWLRSALNQRTRLAYQSCCSEVSFRRSPTSSGPEPTATPKRSSNRRRVGVQVANQHRLGRDGQRSVIEQRAGLPRARVVRLGIHNVAQPVHIGHAQQRMVDEVFFAPKLESVVHQHLGMLAIEPLAHILQTLVDAHQRLGPGLVVVARGAEIG